EVVHRADVTAAMKRLSARDEEVLQLHLWEGLEPREIADVLGVPAAVVRPRLSRARSRLRDLLGPDPGNDPSAPGHLPAEPVTTTRREGHR
ncbi:sigma factor-like helix-turn-helix DNA-binding protein, partial [Nocardioides kongjuensis]